MCKQINNIVEFINAILEVKKKHIDLDQKRLNNGELSYYYERKEFLFRGQSNEDYELIPSLGRGKSNEFDMAIIDNERNLIEKAKFLLPDVFRKDMTPLELLALLQHHGIYTRLMDITENPLVALYFACCSNPTTNGEVFIFKHNNFQIANFPIMNAIADSYKIMIPNLEMTLEDFYHKANNKGYFTDNYNNHDNDKDGATWIETCCSEPLFVYAPIRTERQKMQRGRYILFPNKIEGSNCHHTQKAFKPIIEPISKNAGCIEERYIIPSKAKCNIMSDLKTFGICKEFLFCDSVDIICEEILNDYK